MKLQVAFPVLMTLVAGVQADSILVSWYSCDKDSDITDARDEGCTNVSGFKTDNLCGVEISPHGHCDFYTTSCFWPGGDTYTCNANDGRCNTRDWQAIESYRCFFD